MRRISVTIVKPVLIALSLALAGCNMSRTPQGATAPAPAPAPVAAPAPAAAPVAPAVATKTPAQAPTAKPAAAAAGKRADKNRAVLGLNGWKSEPSDWSNAATLTVAKVGKVNQLDIAYAGGGKDKALISHPLAGTVPANPVLQFRVINPNPEAVTVAIAVKTGKDGLYQEGPQITVPPGKEPQQLVADLGAATFKSAATKWEYTGTITEPGSIRQVQLLIFNGAKPGKLVLTGINLRSKDDQGAKPAPAPR